MYYVIPMTSSSHLLVLIRALYGDEYLAKGLRFTETDDPLALRGLRGVQIAIHVDRNDCRVRERWSASVIRPHSNLPSKVLS